jgi:hypothetical protein
MAPAGWHNDRNVDSTEGQFAIHLLIDGQHRRMADDQETHRLATVLPWEEQNVGVPVTVSQPMGTDVSGGDFDRKVLKLVADSPARLSNWFIW